jgi:hypothetical protein
VFSHMTEEQWAAELLECCRDTGWVIERSGMTRMCHTGLARLHHRTTHQTIDIVVPERFDTAGERRRYILRQLAIAN